MFQSNQRGLWRGETGAAISEFLIVAPILMLLLYAVFDLNDRIDLRQNLQIAARNIAHGGSTINADTSLIKDFSKSSIAVETTSVRSESGSAFEDRVKANLTGIGVHDSYETASSTLGPIVSETANILQGIKGLSIKDEFLLIPDQPESYTVSLKSTQESTIQRGMRLLSNSFAKKADDLIGEQTFLIDSVTMTSIRSEAGFHASKYMYQALPGIFLGQLSEQKHWGKPYDRPVVTSRLAGKVGFTRDCMMYFMGDSNCDPGNRFAISLRVAFVVVGIVKTIVSVGVDNASSEAIDHAANAMGDQAKDLVVRKIEEKATEMAGTQIKKIFDEGGLQKDFESTISKQVSGAMDGVSKNVMDKGVFVK